MKPATLIFSAAALCAFAILPALAQGDAPLAAPTGDVTATQLPPTTPPIIIRHGKIYSLGAAGTLDDGDIRIDNGKITAVGKNLGVPAGATVIDAKGKPVTPGLMASYTQLGIQEIEMVNETNDSEGDSDINTAAFDVADAINPNSTLIPIARIAGVTRSLIAPEPNNGVFFGQAAVIHLGDSNNLLVKRHAGVFATIGPLGADTHRGTRPDTWSLFRETLNDAREYWAQRAGYHKPGGSRDQRSKRIDLEALGPVIRGEEPLIIYANRASDIRQIIAYCTANKLKLVILGAQEGWMAATELAKANVPVIIDARLNLPNSFSEIGATLQNAARMDAAGVRVMFMPASDDPAQYARTITQVAGNAVANGMPWAHALAAITKVPAEVWGIDDSYGTLDPGKDADIVVWDGDPLEVTSAPIAVLIKGKNIPLVSRQTELQERYKNLNDRTMPFAYR